MSRAELRKGLQERELVEASHEISLWREKIVLPGMWEDVHAAVASHRSYQGKQNVFV